MPAGGQEAAAGQAGRREVSAAVTAGEKKTSKRARTDVADLFRLISVRSRPGTLEKALFDASASGAPFCVAKPAPSTAAFAPWYERDAGRSAVTKRGSPPVRSESLTKRRRTQLVSAWVSPFHRVLVSRLFFVSRPTPSLRHVCAPSVVSLCASPPRAFSGYRCVLCACSVCALYVSSVVLFRFFLVLSSACFVFSARRGQLV